MGRTGAGATIHVRPGRTKLSGAAGQVPADDVIGHGEKSTMGAFGAFDARLFADTTHPFVRAGGCVPRLAGLPALEAARIDVVAPTKQGSKERNLGPGRRRAIDEAVHRRLSLFVRDGGLWRDNGLKRRHQLGQVFRDDLPHDVLVDAEAIVDDFVAHPDDVGPRDLRMAVRELSRHLASRFTNDLNEMNQREAKDSSSMCPT